MRLVVPGKEDDPEGAAEAWRATAAKSDGRLAPRPVRSVDYIHEGKRIVATVGQRRQVYSLKRGPRGGYIKGADFVSEPYESGSPVVAIVDRGLISVWTRRPTRGWANPSLVGAEEVRDIEHFDDLPA